MRKTVLLWIFLGIIESCSTQSNNLQYIDPTIGNVGQLLEPTRPTVHQPNQMIRMAPIRKDYLDQYISSFPLNIVSHRLGEVFSLKPTVLPISPQFRRQRMRFDHGLELIKPNRPDEGRAALGRYLQMSPSAPDAPFIRQMIG